jgi:TPR repeat protein
MSSNIARCLLVNRYHRLLEQTIMPIQFSTVFFTAFFLCTSAQVHAQQENFEAGLAAKDRGHYATAIRAWRPLAEQGIAEAQNNLGHMYEEGLGVSQDYTEAMRWYRLAANSELPQAQYNIGLLYYFGYGVSQNPREALRWFRLAAAKDLSDAQYMIGRVFHQTEGFEPDMNEALNWYSMAARGGHPEAQFMYAFMLQAGEGADAGEPYRAYVWSKLAEHNGMISAQDIYNISALTLSDREIAEAELQAQTCINSDYESCVD